MNKKQLLLLGLGLSSPFLANSIANQYNAILISNNDVEIVSQGNSLDEFPDIIAKEPEETPQLPNIMYSGKFKFPKYSSKFNQKALRGNNPQYHRRISPRLKFNSTLASQQAHSRSKHSKHAQYKYMTPLYGI